jgi:hypothetical protein
MQYSGYGLPRIPLLGDSVNRALPRCACVRHRLATSHVYTHSIATLLYAFIFYPGLLPLADRGDGLYAVRCGKVSKTSAPRP